MKKCIYGITILCLMFFGITDVMAKGSVSLDTQTIEIEQGKSATFKILVDNALARAKIKSSNNSIVTVNEAGSWISAGEGKGKVSEHTITVNAIGKAGKEAEVIVEVFDASSYDGDVIATRNNKLTYTVNVKILPKEGTVYTAIFIALAAIITFGGYAFLYKKNSKNS